MKTRLESVLRGTVCGMRAADVAVAAFSILLLPLPVSTSPLLNAID
jgi:hypothetical protein